ncbi:MAG: hypothetical protein ACHQUB_03365 [Candidatus Saccharimonadia bacterium]
MNGCSTNATAGVSKSYGNINYTSSLTMSLETYSGCTGGGTVQLITVSGIGHNFWICNYGSCGNSTGNYTNLLSAYNDIIWSFLSSQPPLTQVVTPSYNNDGLF